MTTVTESDLKELKNLIERGFTTVSEKIETLQKDVSELRKDVTELKIGQAKLEEKMEGISTRLSMLESRTTLQVNWFLVIITALVGGLLTIVGKFTFFPTMPG